MNETIRRQLLDDVIIHPDEDIPRLIYADFLEEYGDKSEIARAEFIRFQCGGFDSQCTCKSVANGRVDLCDVCKLSIRMNRVLLSYRNKWLVGRNNTAASVEKFRRFNVSYRRGFVEELPVSMRWFCNREFITDLFLNHPIQKLKMWGEFPSRLSYDYCFWDKQRLFGGDSSCEMIWDLLSGGKYVETDGRICCMYDSQDSAVRDLEKVCLIYGKSLIGLPELRMRSLLGGYK